MATDIKTSVGRVVWGHPMKAQKKTDQQNQPVLKDGVQVEQWVFGVAFPKAEFLATVWPAMAAEAAVGYPNGVPPQFSWKYKDGDTGISRQGTPLNTREGYPGCFVLTISTESYCPPCFKWEGNSYRQLAANELKTGDFVAVGLNIAVNVPKNITHTPGLYINPRAVELVGYGKEISNGADPNQIFGTAAQRPQYALPPGASLTPLAPSTGASPPQMQPAAPPPMQPGMPGQMPPQPPIPGAPPMQPGMPPQPPMPGYAPAPVTSGVQPAHDFVRQAGMPGQMPGQPPAPPAPPPPPPMAPQRPTDPTHIANPGTPNEQWWNGAAWMPAGR